MCPASPGPWAGPGTLRLSGLSHPTRDLHRHTSLQSMASCGKVTQDLILCDGQVRSRGPAIAGHLLMDIWVVPTFCYDESTVHT